MALLVFDVPAEALLDVVPVRAAVVFGVVMVIWPAFPAAVAFAAVAALAFAALAALAALAAVALAAVAAAFWAGVNGITGAGTLAGAPSTVTVPSALTRRKAAEPAGTSPSRVASRASSAGACMSATARESCSCLADRLEFTASTRRSRTSLAAVAVFNASSPDMPAATTPTSRTANGMLRGRFAFPARAESVRAASAPAELICAPDRDERGRGVVTLRGPPSTVRSLQPPSGVAAGCSGRPGATSPSRSGLLW